MPLMQGSSSTRRILQVAATLSDHFFGRAMEASVNRLACKLGLPAHFVRQLLAIEDKRFQYHAGVDPIAMLRALIFNIGVGPSRLHGASTLTQQIYSAAARQRHEYHPALGFKTAQAFWAIRKTLTSSKSTVLHEYLQTTYLGRSYYRLVAAACGYCNKLPAQLRVSDSFFLVDRIATPNRVSLSRIEILAARRPVATALLSDPGVIPELAMLYERHFACGEAISICLERYHKRSVALTYTSLAAVLNVQ